MAFFLSLLPAIWPWLILIPGQVAALAGRHSLSLSLLFLFGVVSLVAGLMSPLAVAIAGLGLSGAALLPRMTGATAAVGHLVLIVWCLALGAHLLPGFHNLLILDQVRAGPDSGTFTMYLNVDKPMVFFAVLLAWSAMITDKTATKTRPLLIGIGILPLLFLVGLWVDAVRPEVGLPPWWLIFAMSNLFLTCLTEEAFFRGYLQSAITAKFGAAAGLVIASLLFGLAHAGGGAVLILFASLLGLACGLGYYATGRLWVPVLMHFGFNFLHLMLFTYPGPA